MGRLKSILIPQLWKCSVLDFPHVLVPLEPVRRIDDLGDLMAGPRAETVGLARETNQRRFHLTQLQRHERLSRRGETWGNLSVRAQFVGASQRDLVPLPKVSKNLEQVAAARTCLDVYPFNTIIANAN